MVMYADVTNNIITGMASGPGSSRVAVPDETELMDGYIGGVVYPSPAGIHYDFRYYYSLSGLDENDEPMWNVDQLQFTPLMLEKLSEYLQDHLASRFEFTTNDEITAFYKNDQATRLAISDYILDVDTNNDTEYTVDFRARDENDESVYVTLYGIDLKNLGSQLTARMKKAFQADKAIRITHANTPYFTFGEVISDFDTFMETL